MFLSPSNIHFTHCEEGHGLPDMTKDDDMEELSKRLLKNGECPKLQVAEKDGHYFTLNNTRLHVFRWLESAGRCTRVKVDRVPLRVIPEGIRKLMTIGGKSEVEGDSRMKTITYKPVEQRKMCWTNDDEDEMEEGNGSDDSDEEDTESEAGADNHGNCRSSDEQSGEEDSLL